MSAVQTIETVLTERANGRGGWVLTVNLDILRRCVLHPDFRRLTRGVSLAVADGMPLVWASRVQGEALPERVAGSDLIGSLSAVAAERDFSIYLLGGSPGTAERAAEVLRVRSTGLRIAGTACPPLGFEHSSAQVAGIREALIAVRPDIVYVALGSPKQEVLIEQLRDDLPGIWWLGVGASFSFLAGDIRRAPPWMQRLGLEWLHRLGNEPRRLARRYLLHDLPFVVRLFGSAVRARLRRRVMRRRRP